MQPINTIGGFETGGVILDSDPFSLQNNQWSDCRNVRFDNGSVSKIEGEATLVSTSNAPNGEAIYWRQPGSTADSYVYIDSTGAPREKTATGTTDQRMLPGSSVFSTDTRIDLNIFNGGATLIANDGSGAPWFIHSAGATGASGLSQNFTRNSDGWLRTGLSATSAAVVRPFRNVLMAGNLSFTRTSSAGDLFGPSTLRVSNLAARGAVPSWDATYAGATTGDEFDLATNSPIVDMLPFQDAMAVYTTDSIWLVRLTGSSTLPVSVTPGSQGRGMLAKNCGVEYYGRHFVVGSEDIYTAGGGAQISSVADSRVRDYFFSNIDMSQVDLTTVVHNRLQSEIWIGYVKTTTPASTAINEILIYNYDHKTWSIRDGNGASGLLVGAPIRNTAYDNNVSKVVAVHASPNELVETDVGTSFRGDAINSYVERRGFDLAPGSVNVKKWVDSTYYIIRGTGDVRVQAKSTDTPGQPVDFSDTRNNPRDKYLKNRMFSLDADMGDYKVDPRTNGRYYNTRIGSNDTTGSWSLISYTPADWCRHR